MDVLKLFSAADCFVRIVPEPISRFIFESIGWLAGFSNMRGAIQLRKNLQRLVPLKSGFTQRLRSARAMRSYMRYYHEAFMLPYLTPEQIQARVSTENVAFTEQYLQQGSLVGALFHLGNWDLAGAWANAELAPVHTIAEKLNPPELAARFLDFRQSLGMTIYQAVKGANSIGKLTTDMQMNKCFVPLLCDRDLTASGVEVELNGHKLRVAPGSAILSLRTGMPMLPVFIISENFSADKERVKRAGSKWGIKIICGEPIYPPYISDKDNPITTQVLTEMNQQWMDQSLAFLQAHLEDWHMLQKLFVEDLDQARLQRALAKADGKNL